MKKLLFILLAWVVMEGLSAQNNDGADMPALLENKVWKMQLPQDKQYAMEMEFRDAGWRSVFCMMVRERKLFILILYAEIQSKVFESRKKLYYPRTDRQHIDFSVSARHADHWRWSGQMRDRQQPARTMGE